MTVRTVNPIAANALPRRHDRPATRLVKTSFAGLGNDRFAAGVRGAIGSGGIGGALSVAAEARAGALLEGEFLSPIFSAGCAIWVLAGLAAGWSAYSCATVLATSARASPALFRWRAAHADLSSRSNSSML